MTKLRLQISVLVLLLVSNNAHTQKNYRLHIHGVDKDSAVIVSQTGLQTVFTTRAACQDYINRLPDYLQSKGFVTASVDSLYYDSAFARISLFKGNLYRWAHMDTRQLEPGILTAVG